MPKIKMKQAASIQLLRDMPRYKNRMEKIDRERKMRLKEAKDTRNFKVMIQNWVEDKHKPKFLSDKQKLAIYYMTDLTRNFTFEWIATRLNIKRSDLSKWRNDPLFIKEVDKVLNQRRNFMRCQAFKNVARALNRGDMKSTWKYLEMTGDLKQQVEVIDRTGEPSELNDQELAEQIASLQKEIAAYERPNNN